MVPSKKKKKKKWVYLGSTENCHSGSAAVTSQRQSPIARGGELYRGEKEKEAGKATVNGCMDVPG